jgi:hypothetical protein
MGEIIEIAAKTNSQEANTIAICEAARRKAVRLITGQSFKGFQDTAIIEAITKLRRSAGRQDPPSRTSCISLAGV